MRKFKKAISLLTAFAIICGIIFQCGLASFSFTAEAAGVFDGGTGTSSDPYLISTPDQLNAVNEFFSSSFKLENDIDLSAATSAGGAYYYNGAGWGPIGNFTGTFNGNGFSIEGLFINREDEEFVGLFGQSSGTIENLDISSGTIKGGPYTGGIVGINKGTIDTCSNAANVSANSSLASFNADGGGIAGENDSSITNCSNSGDVSANYTLLSGQSISSVTSIAGGIAGYESYNGEFSGCYNSGTVTSNYTSSDLWGTDDYAGGIVGECDGLLVSCHNSGSVNALSTAKEAAGTRAGGIFASGILRLDSISDCYNTGSVMASNSTYSYGAEDMAFGIGPSDYIECCYNTGKVSAYSCSEVDSENEAIAIGIGLAGNISNCYNTGEIDAESYGDTNDSEAEAIGIGGAWWSSGAKLITNCYNTGTINSRAVSSSPSYSPSSNKSSADSSGIGYGIITDCSNYGLIMVNDSSTDPLQESGYAGGISANTLANISKCYNSGSIVSSNTGGGIAGHVTNGKTISDCFNAGSVAANEYGGGIAGNTDNYGTITNCYSLGTVEPSSSSGGIAGKISSGTISNCYYLNTIGQGVGSGSDTATQCTLDQLKQQTTYVGFDFNSTWSIIPNLFPIPNVFTYVPVTSIGLKDSSVTLSEGKSYNLFVESNPMNATFKTAAWSSSDPTTVFVDQAGKIEAKNYGTATITATLLDRPDLSASCIVTVEGIEMKTAPTKTVYVQGQQLNLSGASIAGVGSDGKAFNTAVTSDMVSGYNASTLGQQTITVTYEGQTTTFKVTVIAKAITGISMKANPSKTTYVCGQTLILTGAAITVKYNDGTSQNVSVTSAMVSGYNASALGSQIITVTYGGQTANFSVTVIAKAVVGISMKANPSRITYVQGQALILTGAVITVKYNDGTLQNVSVTSAMVRGYNASTPGQQSITVTYGGHTTSFSVTVLPQVSVNYQAHVQNIGWQNTVSNGNLCGTTGKGLQIEALKISIANAPAGLHVQYRAHVQNIGWQNWVEDGALAGTTGRSLGVEAIQIELTGVDAQYYSVEYQTHVQNIGWQEWMKDGEIAGTTGRNLRVEAIRIKIVPKVPSVTYQSHVQNIGWQKAVNEGDLSGTTGQGLRIEALKINLENAPAGLHIVYRAHVQNIGWQNWVSDGALAGTTGQGLRIEALQIKLQGTDADKYSVVYQAHVQNVGWQNWVSDGATAGTTGRGLRIEAIRIMIVSKS